MPGWRAWIRTGRSRARKPGGLAASKAATFATGAAGRRVCRHEARKRSQRPARTTRGSRPSVGSGRRATYRHAAPDRRHIRADLAAARPGPARDRAQEQIAGCHNKRGVFPQVELAESRESVPAHCSPRHSFGPARPPGDTRGAIPGQIAGRIENRLQSGGQTALRDPWVTLPSDHGKAGWSSTEAGDAACRRWQRVSRCQRSRHRWNHPRWPPPGPRTVDARTSRALTSSDNPATRTRRVPQGTCDREPPCARPCLSYGEWHGSPKTPRPAGPETQATVALPGPRGPGDSSRPGPDRCRADRSRRPDPLLIHQPGRDDHPRWRIGLPAGLHAAADPHGLRCSTTSPSARS